MAYEIGTADGYLDFLNKIATFAAAQGWTVGRNTWSDPSEQQLALSAPGGACHVGMRAVSGTVLENYSYENYYNFELNGFDSFDTNLHVHEQIGAIPQKGFNGSASLYDQTPQLTLTNSKFRYWLFVSETRILIVCRLGSVYVTAYLGLIDATAPISEYPYPLLIAGNLSSTSTETRRIYSFRNSVNYTQSTSVNTLYELNSNWAFGVCQSIGGSKIRLPNGSWSTLKNNDRFANYTTAQFDTVYSKIWPTNNGLKKLSKNIDGSYPLIQCLLISPGDGQAYEGGNWLGFPRGVYLTTGVDNLAENIVTDANAAQYIVFNNVHRTENEQWFAIKLD